jgi:nuclease-like protein
VGHELDDQWAKGEIGESLTGRRAGGSAAARSHDLRRAAPVKTIVARLLGVHTDERAWRRGAAGERVTAWWLGRLPDGWHLFNDVPVGQRGANIDHVVVGPAGVFTVNAKNLTGKVWVSPTEIRHNGHKTDFLRKSVFEATRASTLLSAATQTNVDVQAVLAILADDWTVVGHPVDVFVGPPRGVKDRLRRLEPTLSTRDVTLIASAVAKPVTWTRTAHVQQRSDLMSD